MDIYFAGGAMEIGGSCIDVRLDGYHLVMDAGIRQGAGVTELLPDFHGVQQRGPVDAIIISHAHMDHTGSLPLLSKSYPDCKIYMTSMTQDLTRILLYDSLKLMAMREEELPQYSETDVQNMLERIVPLHYQQMQEILPGVTLTFYPAGHIAGAACTYLTAKEGTFFYSGDISGFAQQTIEGIGLPKLRPDVSILEATYGNRLHASRALEEERLIQLIAKYIAEGKKILIPAFALGRSQEILRILRRAFQDKQLPEIPVWVDGMIRDMNRAYLLNPTYLKRSLARQILKGIAPFYTDNIQPVERLANREDLTRAKGPCIFVASSGMLMGGPSTTYAKALMPREDAAVILTGYQDEESPGRALLKLLEQNNNNNNNNNLIEERRITLDNVSLPVRCQIEMVGLSAHADSNELCAVAEKLGSRHVILQHGSEEAITTLAQTLAGDYKRRVYLPSTGETVEIALRNKRKQPGEALDHLLCQESFEPETDAKALWQFVTEHYPARSFTLEQIAKIWFGPNHFHTEEELVLFQVALLDSGYFERNPRRLYLLRPCSQDAVETYLASLGKAPTVQEIEAFLRAQMQGVEIRKCGFHTDTRTATVATDYPDRIDPNRIDTWAEALSNQYGWRLEFRRTMNFQAAGDLIGKLFGTRVVKISSYQEKKSFCVRLDAPDAGDETRAQTFEATTGWQLTCEYLSGLGGESLPDRAPDRDLAGDFAGFFYPPADTEQLEQNMAFALMDYLLEEDEIRPYKRGRKRDAAGDYMELWFLSPALGQRVAERIQTLADRTGWRMHIAENVNLQAVSRIAQELCADYGLLLAKNPAYLSMQGGIRLTVAGDAPIPDDMRTAFLAQTGLKIL